MPARGPDERHASAADLAACAALLRSGSRSFFCASLVLPRAVRDPATALYAFCRLADDAVDQGDDHAGAIANLHARLDAAYAGRPHDFAPDRAFADVVREHAIPRALPAALIEGFEWDAQGRVYEDLPQLYAYAARVAGSVGAMLAMLMGARAPDTIARACDLGVAMQLTNIARDVGEDAAIGRLYLPRRWLREAGIDPQAWLARPVFDAALAGVIARVLEAADVLYARAGAGIARLPLACRPSMHAARFLYAGIGREVERLGLDSVSQRAVVPPARKVRSLASALLATLAPASDARFAALDEVRFLVDAVASAPPAGADAAHGVLDEKVGWLVDLFDRLERRERAAPAGGAFGGRQWKTSRVST